MAKRKPRAEISVADGAGGMVRVHDRRFQDNWPVQLQVSKELADTWVRYLSAASEPRGWSLNSLSQHERNEDSGTVTINQQARMVATIVWERKRGGALSIRARSEAQEELSNSDFEALLHQITTRCAARETKECFRWGCLEYEGLPWRGELWLDDTIRLGRHPGRMKWRCMVRAPCW